MPRLKPPAVPSEKTCLFREANRLRGLSLYPHFTKCCRFPLTSCGFVERDWKVIWKWLNLKTKQEKNWVSFFFGKFACKNCPLLKETGVWAHRDVAMTPTWWSSTEGTDVGRSRTVKELFLLLLRNECLRIYYMMGPHHHKFAPPAELVEKLH